MRQDIGQKIRSEIRGDESLIWSGQPKGGYQWYAADIIRIPFSLIWLSGASFIAFMSLTSPFLPIYLKAIFFLFVAIGVYFNSLKWIDKKLREQTFYGLTDKHVIIISEFIRRCVNKFDLNDLGEMTLIPETDDRGTISFGLERFKRLRSNVDSINYQVPINKPFLVGEGASYMLFESIEHAQDVYNKVAEAQQKRINDLKLSGRNEESKNRAALNNFWAYVKIALITIPAVLVFGFVFIPQIFGPGQQTKEVQQRMGKVTYQSITSVDVSLVSNENRKTVQLDPADYEKVTEYLRNMSPTKNLGMRGPWHYYREVDVYAGEIGHFRLTLMTRKSLDYKALANVNIVDGASEDSLIVFFDANDFWNWLKERPVVAQQLDEHAPATQRSE